VGAFVTVFIIRNLSVKDYGVYTVLYSMIAYVSVIASFGIPSVFQRFIPEALQKKEYSLIKILVFRGLMLRILLSAITVCVILLFHGPIGRLFKIEGFLGYFSIFAWGIVLYLEAVLLANVLHSLFLHKYSVIASTIYTIFRGISVFVLLNFGLGIKGVLLAEVAAWALWTFLQYYFYYINFAQPHTSSEKSQLPLWRFFRYGGLSSLNELGSSVLGTSTDFFVITAFLGPGAVAFYAFADRIIKMFVSCMPRFFYQICRKR
jgi:O-antigen/teichoic acid export membrane protein